MDPSSSQLTFIRELLVAQVKQQILEAPAIGKLYEELIETVTRIEEALLNTSSRMAHLVTETIEPDTRLELTAHQAIPVSNVSYNPPESLPEMAKEARRILKATNVEIPSDLLEKGKDDLGIRSLMITDEEGKIFCLECGQSFKEIHPRHLAAHNLTVSNYKGEYNIPASYPLKPLHAAAPIARGGKKRVKVDMVTSVSSVSKPHFHIEESRDSDVKKLEALDPSPVPSGMEDSLGMRSLYCNPSQILCLECGKWQKIITKAHLKHHALDPKAYKEKWGIELKTKLASAETLEERRLKSPFTKK